MPFVRIDVAGGLDATVRRELLVRTAEVFATILQSPIERVRTQVVELPADSFAVGGVPIAESAIQAPFVTVAVLAGRPPHQHLSLITELSSLVADITGAPLDRVRVRIDEVPPALWGIGGRPATSARRGEIDARADAISPPTSGS